MIHKSDPNGWLSKSDSTKNLTLSIFTLLLALVNCAYASDSQDCIIWSEHTPVILQLPQLLDIMSWNHLNLLPCNGFVKIHNHIIG